MQKLSANKKMKIIKLYLNGFSYDEISTKTSVSKGTVANVTSALKAGQFPEISTIPEEIEQLRDLATNIKRSGISPIQASIGLSILERLVSLGIEPAEIEKCHTLLQALSSPSTDLTIMAKSILAIEEVKQKTGLTLDELEAKVIALRQEAEKLAPLSVEIENKEKELLELESAEHKLHEKIMVLNDRQNSLEQSINRLELRESQLAGRVADLEERAYTADKQLYEARRDLKTLSKVGMGIEDLSKFSVRLKEISAHHDIKPEDLYRRLLKELRQLDKGLSLESLVEEKRTELAKVDTEIASRKDTKAEGVLDKAGITTKEIDKVNEESKKGSGARILAVDDEPIILELIAEVLTAEGYEVETIDNPRDALEQIKTKRCDLLLLDIHMPYMSGFELYEHIKKINQRLASKVVFMTSKSNFTKKHMRDFLSKTKAPCITKPFVIQQFKRKIKRMLSQGTQKVHV